ncbi:MAG TPA: MmcQ/YjbR family DNA-binding protein [Planctomycetota bacterium]|jgi:predicted DNA-binding protein (MmcQ/YjbR family)|nr:MmcQ/YjbR family DNA-binding protein [Planctomycetota bacterium]
MAKSNPVLARVRAICLALPDTKETPTWGQPHFRVGEKIFAGCGEEKGRVSIGFKLEMKHAREIVEDPRFTPAPYVGHKGWVSLDGAKVSDWDELRELILESYELIAPRKSLAKLAGESAELAPAKRPKRVKATKKKSLTSRK